MLMLLTLLLLLVLLLLLALMMLLLLLLALVGRHNTIELKLVLHCIRRYDILYTKCTHARDKANMAKGAGSLKTLHYGQAAIL